MIKRLNIYLKEMFPLVNRLFASAVVFFAIYFLVILANNITEINIGIVEVAGVISLFCFWLFLRIADEFKDYDTDLRLFPHRAFPSGRVLKKDLITLMTVDIIIMLALNIFIVKNIGLFLLALGYVFLMSNWFFMKKYIKPNLIFALISHNPVQILLNFYMISIVCNKYSLDVFTFDNFLINMMLFFPATEWEIGRKIRKPEDETEYVTYSKIMGFKNASYLLLGVTFLELIVTMIIIVKFTNPVFLIWLVILFDSFVVRIRKFTKNPDNQMIKYSETYITLMQVSLVLIAGFTLVQRFF